MHLVSFTVEIMCIKIYIIIRRKKKTCVVCFARRFKAKLPHVNKIHKDLGRLRTDFLRKKYFCSSANPASSSGLRRRPTFLYIRLGKTLPKTISNRGINFGFRDITQLLVNSNPLVRVS